MPRLNPRNANAACPRVRHRRRRRWGRGLGEASQPGWRRLTLHDVDIVTARLKLAGARRHDIVGPGRARVVFERLVVGDFSLRHVTSRGVMVSYRRLRPVVAEGPADFWMGREGDAMICGVSLERGTVRHMNPRASPWVVKFCPVGAGIREGPRHAAITLQQTPSLSCHEHRVPCAPLGQELLKGSGSPSSTRRWGGHWCWCPAPAAPSSRTSCRRTSPGRCGSPRSRGRGPLVIRPRPCRRWRPCSCRWCRGR